MPRPLVGVMGSGNDACVDLADPLGRWLAQQGFDLLTGGGGGIMAAVCRGFASVPNRRGSEYWRVARPSSGRLSQ